jgi:hypothetical protein
LYPALAPLVRVLKLLPGLNVLPRGISSYGLVLLVAGFLRAHANAQPPPSLGALLLRLLGK